MKTLVAILLALMILNLAPKSFAFGPEGHRIVVNIALQYLSPTAKKKVLQILGTTTTDSAAVWMDVMRDDTAYKYMKPWHFINIDKGKAYDPTSKNNIIWELNRVYAELQHPENLSANALKKDLMILLHLMGDLHQPLHVGYGEDRGGNDVKVSYKGFQTDLHHFWDSDMIWNQHITADAVMKLSKTSAQQVAKTKFSSTQFVDYMKESRALLPKVYAFGSGGIIDQNYVVKNKQVIMLQLLRGGQRLATILQKLYGTA